MANSYEYKTFNVEFQVKKSMNPIVDEGERELHDRIKEHSSEGWRLRSNTNRQWMGAYITPPGHNGKARIKSEPLQKATQ